MAAIGLQKSLASPSRKVIGVEIEQLIEGDERIRERLSEVLFHATAQVHSLIGKNYKYNDENRLP